jgi:hypothetical protein
MFESIGGAVMKLKKVGSRTGICLVIIIGNASLYFGKLKKELQLAIIVFGGFLMRGPSRKSRTWRSATRVQMPSRYPFLRKMY